MPRHGVGKENTRVERDNSIDNPFIIRFKLLEGWKLVEDILINTKKRIYFWISNVRYSAYSNSRKSVVVHNPKNGSSKIYKEDSDIMKVCQVIITSDRWMVND